MEAGELEKWEQEENEAKANMESPRLRGENLALLLSRKWWRAWVERSVGFTRGRYEGASTAP